MKTKNLDRHYNWLIKTICVILTLSLVSYPCPRNLSASAETNDTLAAFSRINKYAEANKFSIDIVKFTMAASGLKQAIIDESGSDKQILTTIQKQNLYLEGTGITFEEKIYKVKLQKRKSKAICLKVLFPGNEVRWIYFIKDHGKINPEILRKIGIVKPEDIVYFNQSPLAGVWMSKHGPGQESSYKTGTRIIALALLDPLLALLSPGCLEAPTMKDFAGFCFKGEDCRVTDGTSTPDVPDATEDTTFGDAIIYPSEQAPEVAEPDTPESPPDVAFLETVELEDIVELPPETEEIYADKEQPDTMSEDTPSDQKADGTDISIDYPPQNPDIDINEGGLFTNNQIVTLYLSVDGATEMIISEKPDFSDAQWEPYNTTKEFILSPSDGIKTIYVKFKNSVGETPAVKTSIILDQTLPQIEISSPQDGSVTDESEIVVDGTYTEAYIESITVNEVPAQLINGTFSAEVPLNEDDNIITIKATDKAGNSTIETIKVKYEPIVAPQNPSISIQGNLEYTNSPFITLELSVQGAKEMIISEKSDFSDTQWELYNPTKEFILSPGDGLKTIYAEYKNSAGESEVVSTKITLDQTLPQIDISSPQDNSVTNESEIIVKGTYTEAYIESITVNEVPAQLINGTFSANIALQEGDNLITVIITDKAGNSTKKIIIVSYIPGKDILGISVVCDELQKVTLLPSLTTEGAVDLYLDPEYSSKFVCGNNAPYKLGKDAKISKELTQDEKAQILNNGITVITNGVKAHIKIKGTSDGLEKTVIFNLKPIGVVDSQNPKPYKFVISPSDLLQYFGELTYIEFQNFEPNQNLILNGFLFYYAVATSPTTVQNPTQIGSYWTNYNSPGVSPTITPLENGIEISATLESGSEQFVGVEITPIVKTDNNIALQATVTASSYFKEWWGEYDPQKAIDNCFSADFEGQICEWASSGPLPQWIELKWPNSELIWMITLYDRKTVDVIKNGVLDFSDGTNLQTGALPAEGYPNGKSFEFPPKKITWVKLTITDSNNTKWPGLGEFQAFEAKDKTNFLANALQLLSNVTGNTPFVIELVDNKGETISIPILTPNSSWQGVIADLLDAVQKNNPDLNLANIAKFRIVIPAKLIPVEKGEQYNVWIKIQGLFAKVGTRGEYATDPDLTEEEKKVILNQIPPDKREKVILEGIQIPTTGYNIYAIKDIDIVTPLGFNIGGRIISAFFDGKDIYIPHPDLIYKMFEGYPVDIKNTLLAIAKKRLEIILGHELDEANGISHAEAVLNEFSKHDIDGLNYADIATILFKSLTGVIDSNFHRRFLSNLFTQGMGLFMTPETYLKIITEMLDPKAKEEEIKSIYKTTIAEFDNLVSTVISGKEFTYNTKEFNSQPVQFQDEAGFSKLIKETPSLETKGVILIDLGRFFIKNQSLSSAVTIDTEYIKRFIAFSRMLPQGIKIIGLTDKDKSNILIAQLLAIINSQLPDGKFEVRDNINFDNYIDSIGPIDLRNSVYILIEETLSKIPDNIKAQLKIVAPANLGYNRVTDAGYEFYAAWEGLDKTKNEFVTLIYNLAIEILEHLLASNKITSEERDAILAEIKRSGIGFIPSYYDPIQYYKTIESQKALLIAA